MRAAKLIRSQTGDAGTFGTLSLDDGFLCVTGELPWRDNQHGISCIPVGTYIVQPFNSPKHGSCFLLQNVHGRTDVEIHAANWMGDVSKGYKSDLRGCIAVGDSTGELLNQMAVLNSGVTLKALVKRLGGFPFRLTISETYS